MLEIKEVETKEGFRPCPFSSCMECNNVLSPCIGDNWIDGVCPKILQEYAPKAYARNDERNEKKRESLRKDFRFKTFILWSILILVFAAAATLTFLATGSLLLVLIEAVVTGVVSHIL